MWLIFLPLITLNYLYSRSGLNVQRFFSKAFESLDASDFVAAPESDKIPFFARIRQYARKAWKEEEFTCIERYRMTRLCRDTYSSLQQVEE